MGNFSRRVVILAVVLLVAAGLIFQGGKYWLAAHWKASSKPEDWMQAAELELDNAASWYLVGQFFDKDFERSDADKAITYYRKAIELNPRSATYWMALASAYDMEGEPDRAREAFEQAKKAFPVSAAVAWSYGNFLLRQGRVSEGFAEIRQAVTNDPKLARQAIHVCWRVSGDVDRALEVLPPDHDILLQALQFFLSHREITPALAVWDRLLSQGQSINLRRAFPLLKMLMQEGRLREAKKVWREALWVSGSLEREMSTAEGNSLIWNGGFEQDLANGGFGWRQQRAPGARFDFDHTMLRSGNRSLRITFEGTTNLNFLHLIQYVPVEPQRTYRLEAFLRTEGISTDSGVRLHISDFPPTAALGILTPDLRGSQPWSLQEAEFTTGRNTRLLRITLRRLPSRKFDNKIRGTVWIDDVSVVPVDRRLGQGTP